MLAVAAALPVALLAMVAVLLWWSCAAREAYLAPYFPFSAPRVWIDTSPKETAPRPARS